MTESEAREAGWVLDDSGGLWFCARLPAVLSITGEVSEHKTGPKKFVLTEIAAYERRRKEG